jgi:hypothetical protein
LVLWVTASTFGAGATPIESGSSLFGENAFFEGVAYLELELGDA